MKDQNSLNNIINDLKSTDWATFSKAQESLNSIYHITDIRYLYEESIRTKDESLKKFIAQKISDLTTIVEKVEFLGQLIFYLCLYESDHLYPIHKDAKKILDHFFDNKQVNLFIKVECIRFAWKKNTNEIKLYLTKKIAEKKYFQLSSLILDNIENGDDKLIDLSIKTLKYLNDGRGPRYLNKILKGNNHGQIVSSILTIGEIGQWFDSIRLLIFLKHPDESIRQSTIWAMTNLLKTFSLPVLYFMYSKQSESTKSQIIDRIGSIQNTLSTWLLLDIYSKNKTEKTFKEIAWALFETKVKYKSGPLIYFYKKYSLNDRNSIVILMCDCRSPEIYKFILKYIEDSYNLNSDHTTLLKCFDSLTFYNKKESIDILERYIFDNKFQKGHLAVSSLLQHKEYNYINFINNLDFKNKKLDDNYHNAIISFLSTRGSNSPYNSIIEDYLLTLSSKNQDQFIQKIINGLSVYPYPNLFKTIFKTLKSTENKNIKKIICHKVLEIMSKEEIIPSNLLCFLRDETVVEYSNREFISHNFINAFLKSNNKNTLIEYHIFLTKHCLLFSEFLPQIISAPNEVEFHLLLIIIHHYLLEISRNNLFLLNEVYDKITNEDCKILILKILLKSKDQEANSFSIKKIIGAETISKYFWPLLRDRIGESKR